MTAHELGIHAMRNSAAQPIGMIISCSRIHLDRHIAPEMDFKDGRLGSGNVDSRASSPWII
jgi:hypothetical protein